MSACVAAIEPGGTTDAGKCTRAFDDPRWEIPRAAEEAMPVGRLILSQSSRTVAVREDLPGADGVPEHCNRVAIVWRPAIQLLFAERRNPAYDGRITLTRIRSSLKPQIMD